MPRVFKQRLQDWTGIGTFCRAITIGRNLAETTLDGSAHAWHHSIAQLARSIKQGGIQLVGVMPGFTDKLDDQQILALTAFFQQTWPDEIYQPRHNRHMQ